VDTLAICLLSSSSSSFTCDSNTLNRLLNYLFFYNDLITTENYTLSLHDALPILEEFAEAHGKEVPTIEDEVYQLFYNYDWPGNVRELMNALEYAILFHDGGIISTNCLPNSIQRLNKNYTQQEREVLSPLQMKEKMKLQELIIETNGNLSEVARRCKIARTTLYRKIEKYHLKY